MGTAHEAPRLAILAQNRGTAPWALSPDGPHPSLVGRRSVHLTRAPQTVSRSAPARASTPVAAQATVIQPRSIIQGTRPHAVETFMLGDLAGRSDFSWPPESEDLAAVPPEHLVGDVQSIPAELLLRCQSVTKDLGIVSRVMPPRMLITGGVVMTPRRTTKMFSPVPSATSPFVSSMMASSKPLSLAS